MKKIIVTLSLLFSAAVIAEVVSYNLIAPAQNISMPAPGLLKKFPLLVEASACAECEIHHLKIVNGSEFYFENTKIPVAIFAKKIRENPGREVRVQFNKNNKNVYAMHMPVLTKDIAL